MREMSWDEQEEQDDLFAPREGMLPCCEHCTHGPLITGHADPCPGCEDSSAAYSKWVSETTPFVAICGGSVGVEEEEEPCCLLYREPYLADHEYGCPSRAREEGRTWSPPADK